MSLVSYNELCEFVEKGVIEGVDLKDVNGTSIDVYLGNKILVERYAEGGKQVVSLYMQTKTVTARWFDDSTLHHGVNTTISLK